MALQEKILTPEVARPATTIKIKNSWDTISVGRVFHWFPQTPIRHMETPPSRVAVVRDHRPPRAQSLRRKVA